jgi:hypothetical protein
MFTNRLKLVLSRMWTAERYLYNHQRAVIMADPLDGPRRWMDHITFLTSKPCWY